jgi:predicted HicB family RNase H-like nuclease
MVCTPRRLSLLHVGSCSTCCDMIRKGEKVSKEKRRKMSPEVEHRSERVAVRLTPETKAKAEEAAREADITLSKWLERLVRSATSGKPN